MQHKEDILLNHLNDILYSNIIIKTEITNEMILLGLAKERMLDNCRLSHTTESFELIINEDCENIILKPDIKFKEQGVRDKEEIYKLFTI